MPKKPYLISEADILMAVEYVKENQPCRSNDVAAHIGRSTNSTRQMLARDSRFDMRKLDNGNILFSLALRHGPYDILGAGGDRERIVIHHKEAGASRAKAHKPFIDELCLFALQPWLVSRGEDERFHRLQSPRLYAAD